MKTVMKKLFSLMLVAVLLVSAVPFQAAAAETTLSFELALAPGSYDVNTIAASKYNGSSTNYWVHRTAPAAEDYVRGSSFDAVEGGTYTLYVVENVADPEPAPQPCAVCGKAAHEGVCCATCKQTGHEAGDHCASCGSLDHAASAHCADCGAVGSHTAACPTQQPVAEYVTFVYTPDGSTELVMIQNGKVTTPAGKVFNGWRFDGWQYQGGLKNAGATIEVSGPTTIYASYKDTNPTATYDLNVYVRRYVGNVLKETSFLQSWDTMQKNDKVLEWLNAHKADLRTKVNNRYPGYSWSGNFYNFHNDQVATDNVVTNNGEKNVYINIYDDQETVLVYVHLNNNKTHSTLIQMDGYSVGETVTYKSVLSAVQKHYNVSKLSMYSDTAWDQHIAGKNPVSTKGIVVESGTTKIHVNLTNASAAGTSSSSKADSSNPKTGDMIFMPTMVLGLSASALAVMFYLNKKRSY